MKDMGKGLAKRLSALALALALMLTMVPATVFAAETRTVTFSITDSATSKPIDDADVTITAPAGVTVVGYTAQVEATATDISYTVTRTGYKTVTKNNVAIPENGVINEEMEADTVTVSASATGSGTVTVNGAASATVNRGSEVNVVITPAEGHWIESVQGHSGLDFTKESKTGYSKEITITEETTISATFVKYFTVTV